MKINSNSISDPGRTLYEGQGSQGQLERGYLGWLIWPCGVLLAENTSSGRSGSFGGKTILNPIEILDYLMTLFTALRHGQQPNRSL